MELRRILSLLGAVAVSLFLVGSSVAVADVRVSYGGRGAVSGGRNMVRGAPARGGRQAVRNDRYGKRYGGFRRDRRNYERAFISFGGGSYRRGYRSSRSFFFGYSFSWSEYRRGSNLGYRRDMRRDYRSDVPRAQDSSTKRAAIDHPSSQSGTKYVPLVASSAAPEVLPIKD